jgi:hypothetical protein
MRAKEFVNESKKENHPELESGSKDTKINPDHASTMKNIHKTRDVGGYDRVYHMNRLWMAMAMADGKDHKPVDMDASSWTEKYNTIHPYTDAEENMVHQAMATIPTDHKVISRSNKSVEPDYIHKVSPHVPFKGYER